MVVIITINALEVLVVSPHTVEEVHLVSFDCSDYHLIVNLDAFVLCNYQSIINEIKNCTRQLLTKLTQLSALPCS